MLVTPVDAARAYYEAGCDELVFLDITATHEKRDTTVDMARRVADQVLFLLQSAAVFVLLRI